MFNFAGAAGGPPMSSQPPTPKCGIITNSFTQWPLNVSYVPRTIILDSGGKSMNCTPPKPKTPGFMKLVIFWGFWTDTEGAECHWGQGEIQL